jgi:peroxiredoxin Q/BCP
MVQREGVKAPNFKLFDQDGNIHQLSDYAGKVIVLYFYPKDDTPGCVKEACSFRDNFNVFKQQGVVVLGVSPDSIASHAKFKEKYALTFTLLADEDHAVCELYGVWGLKKLMGKEYNGVFRTTFVIDENGFIIKVYENVRPDEHAQEILAMLAARE